MSDTELRELERRWKKSGAEDDYTDYVSALVRAAALSDEAVRVYAHLGNPAARAAAPDAPLERWAALVEFVRTWFAEPLRPSPTHLEACAERLELAEEQLGRAIPESLREWFLLTDWRPDSELVDFPGLPTILSSDSDNAVLSFHRAESPFGFSASEIGMMGEGALDAYFEVLAGADHWSWSVRRDDLDPDPAVVFTGEGGPGADGFPGPLSALLTFAVAKATLEHESFERGSASDRSGAMGTFADGVRLLDEDDLEWFEGPEVVDAYVPHETLPVDDGLFLTDPAQETLLYCWTDQVEAPVRGALTRTPGAQARLDDLVSSAKEAQEASELEASRQREAERRAQAAEREARLAEEFDAQGQGRSDEELVATLEANLEKLLRFERPQVTDMRRHLNAGALSGAQRLKAAQILKERLGQ